MSSKENKWFVIVNPHAGSGRTVNQWHKAEKALSGIGIAYECAETRYGGHAAELVRDAAREGYRRFAAVGGDGTAHEVFNGILRYYDAMPEGTVSLQDFAMAVIPIGSGNDWIKTHEIPDNISKVFELMKAESFVCQDVVKVSQPDGRVDYMLNVAGVGFDSRICEIVNIEKSQGKSGGSTLYAKALMKVIKHFYSFKVDVRVDGKQFFLDDCFSIAFGVGQWSGGGMRQVPDAVVDDGLLDMMIVPKMPIRELVPKVPHLFTGKLGQFNGLLHFAKAKCVEVLPLPDGEHLPELIEVDGETVGRIPCKFEVLPCQIRVLSALKR